MTIDEASKILELSPDATPEQIENRFNELRARLEDKLAKAPTPGLKDKYRRSLDEVTKALETLILAADASELPVLQRGEPKEPGAPGPTVAASGSSAAAAPFSVSKKRSSNKEFLVVALIAVVLLGSGGWWVAKTRAENAERERMEVEAAAAAERQAEKARTEAENIAAEEKRLAEEEKARVDALFATVRADQAEAKIRWEAMERDLGQAERRLAELKSDARNTRDLPAPQMEELQARLTAQEDFVNWLQPYLARHPAKTQLARLDALLSAKALAEAATTEQELKVGLEGAEREILSQRTILLAITSPVVVESSPSGLPYIYQDAYGREGSGNTPFVGELPLGAFSVHVRAGDGWPDYQQRVLVKRGSPVNLKAEFPHGSIEITSDPAGMAYELTTPGGYKSEGYTPMVVTEVPAGEALLSVKRGGWAIHRVPLTIKDGERSSDHVVFASGSLSLSTEPAGLSFSLHNDHGYSHQGKTPAVIDDIPAGQVDLKVERAWWPVEHRSLVVTKDRQSSLSIPYVGAQLDVVTDPPGADVFVGAARIGLTPLHLPDIAPGERRLSIRKDGYFSEELVVDLAAGEAKSASAALRSTAATVYIFRPLQLNGGAGTLEVFANRELAANLWGARFVKISLPPGEAELSAGFYSPSRFVKKTLSPGSIAYFLAKVSGTFSVDFELEEVDAATGEAAVAKYKQADNLLEGSSEVDEETVEIHGRLEHLLNVIRPAQAFLGVNIQNLTSESVESAELGLSDGQGALVVDVVAESPAAKEGIQRGDVIIQINGRRIVSADEVRMVVSQMVPGETAIFHLVRNRKSEIVEVNLGELD